MGENEQPEGLRDLFADAIDSGRTLVRAEIAYYRASALAKVDHARLPLILLVAAVLIIQASLTALFVGLGFALAFRFGPFGGGIVAALLGLALAGILALIAKRRFAAGSAIGDKKR
ncbi:phage holin family protein [Sphingomonas oleivorans]|nr:phage holin family protein [Sphingomonas oleivorans]